MFMTASFIITQPGSKQDAFQLMNNQTGTSIQGSTMQ